MHSNKDSHQPPAGADALVADFTRQLARVGVDPRLGLQQLHELATPVTRPLPDGTWEESFTINVSAIVDTLRALPDNAGTAAFVAAYNAAHPGPERSPYRED